MDISQHLLLTSSLGLAGVSLFMFGAWILSLRLKDASIVDRLWGLNFILLASIYFSQSQNIHWRHWMVLFLLCVWGGRLSLHIHLRNRHHGEDHRYQAMRKNHGTSFSWYSLFSVFLLQGFLAFLISTPILWIFSGSVTTFTVFDPIAICLWGVGFYFEAVGDMQLKAFKADPKNIGKILDRGLWALTRHPNYFGDALIWWSFFLLALSLPNGWMTFFGPLIMTIFLRSISGVTLLEKSLIKTKPGYMEYVSKTPAFIPNFRELYRIICVALGKKNQEKKGP
jgi:steroid 5-alpha reductase family enzyme